MALPGRACDLVLLGATGSAARLAAARSARARLRDSGDPANHVTVRCLCKSGLTMALDFHALRAAGMQIEIGGTP